MKPLDHKALIDKMLDNRGRRCPATVYVQVQVERLYRLAARSFYPDLPAAAQADRLAKDTLRYSTGTFRRSHGPTCEAKHLGTVIEIIHLILRLRDRCHRARTIRRWL
ncbi:MAG: hypothetical protein C0480_10110 [Bradyrhizobium sp.]|nr:hypothetical protein [Bradyrhizobium sp.]